MRAKWIQSEALWYGRLQILLAVKPYWELLKTQEQRSQIQNSENFSVSEFLPNT